MRLPANTRFGYFYLVVERVLQMKEAFQKAAVDGRFNDRSWNEKDNEYVEWKRMVMDDEFFKKLYEIYAIFAVPYFALRQFDASTIGAAFVFDIWYQAHDELAQLQITNEAEVGQAPLPNGGLLTLERRFDLASRWESRWTYAHHRIFGAAFAVNPAFQTEDIYATDEKVDPV